MTIRQTGALLICFGCLLGGYSQAASLPSEAVDGSPAVASPATPTGEPLAAGGSPVADEERAMDELRTCVVGKWTQVRDTPDETVYVSENVATPAARGHRGFELRGDGAAFNYGIAPTDGSTVTTGHWTVEGPSTIRIDWEDANSVPWTLEIASCDRDQLTVKKQ